MVILKHFALVLLLACVAQQVLVIDGEKGQGRKERRDGKGGEERLPENPPATGNDRAQSGKAFLRGKFSIKDKTQCTWSANEEDVVTIGVVCSKDGVGFNCEYSARPAACAPYASNAKTYWKQIARALKKQKNICQDAGALVKAGMCKKAPKEAHFKLMISGPPPPPVQTEDTRQSSSDIKSAVQPEDTRQSSSDIKSAVQPEDTRQSSSDMKSCPDKTDQKKLAEEYCSGSWVTFCNFFFKMVQSEDC